MTVPLRLLLVGPLPPPSGGMANQTRQLKRLLEAEGLNVEIVQTNAPYWPSWIEAFRGARAVFRFLPYVFRLFRKAAHADVVHVMANSGWAWHLSAVPAIRVAAWHGKAVVVNYRGGLAREFLSAQANRVRRDLTQAAALIVPSRFLKEVFSGYGISATVIPNVVDTNVFSPSAATLSRAERAPHVVVSRNLEHLYGNDTAVRAFALLRERMPGATLSIAGSGPEFESLQYLTGQLGLSGNVTFTGRLETSQMVALYQSASVLLNPARADNAPNSVLEALACGIPVVSTNVGGVPFLVEHGRTAWLVPPESPQEMADGLRRVLTDEPLRHSLAANGLDLARSFSWPSVKRRWLDLYETLAERQV